MRPNDYHLEKRVWTDADFERMGWHDCPIRGISTVSEFPERLEFLLDIDYIFEWSNQGTGNPFMFLMAPATLVFENVFFLQIEIDSRQGDLDLDEIRRQDGELAPDGTTKYWLWTLDLHEGNIRFRSTGYRQYIRKEPVLNKGLHMALDERGGISFERPTEFSP